MNFCIIIPAHNEDAFIDATLKSLTEQTLQPSELIIVNDNSTDDTAKIAKSYATSFSYVSVVNTTSSNQHLPGSKIINAFNKGLISARKDFDIVCKFDADLIFPNNYLEKIATHFRSDPKVGMVAGFCYIEKNGKWILENLTRKDHIRGALKAYRKDCFEAIGHLKSSMGWDTVDELLAKYHGWKIVTDESLHVKHLKPTGQSYNKASKYMQGMAMYKMRYGFWITLISAIKLAYKKGSFNLFMDYLSGFLKAKRENIEFLVTEDEGKFIRQIRWRGIKNKGRH